MKAWSELGGQGTVHRARRHPRATGDRGRLGGRGGVREVGEELWARSGHGDSSCIEKNGGGVGERGRERETRYTL